jgi:hypothetical protein
MADKKISALTAASTPLAGSEVLPIVQSGATVKVSVANLTNGRTQTSNGIVQGTAATGYNFTANTPAAGMTSQLLNWYEEGTWTPSYSGFVTNSGTLTAQANYVRIGNQVTYSWVQTGGNISVGLSASITGFPFSYSTSGRTYGAGSASDTAKQSVISMYQGSPTVSLYFVSAIVSVTGLSFSITTLLV